MASVRLSIVGEFRLLIVAGSHALHKSALERQHSTLTFRVGFLTLNGVLGTPCVYPHPQQQQSHPLTLNSDTLPSLQTQGGVLNAHALDGVLGTSCVHPLPQQQHPHLPAHHRDITAFHVPSQRQRRHNDDNDDSRKTITVKCYWQITCWTAGEQ